MEDVIRRESAAEAAMLEWMIQMIVGVVTPRIMAAPLTVGMHVRSVGMSGSIVEIGRLRGAMFLARRRRIARAFRAVLICSFCPPERVPITNWAPDL
jgi:hypothetical protein